MSTSQKDCNRKFYHETLFISVTVFVFTIAISVPNLKAQIQSGNTAYLIKSKTSQKVLQTRVAGSSSSQQVGFPGFPVTQDKVSKSKEQKFSFALGAGRTYFIKTYDKLYVSVKYRAAVASSNTGASSGISTLKLVQDKRYSAPQNPAVANASKPDDQRWQLVPVDGDGFTYLIQNVGFPDVVLESSAVSAEVMLATKTGSENQKWFISEPDNLLNSDQANSEELRIFNDIISNQEGVGLLEENPKPIYYTYKLKPPGANSTIDMVYKYKKIIDKSKVPASLVEKGKNWANEKLKGHENVEKVVTYSSNIFQDFLDLGGDIVSFFTGSSSKMAIDCWVPVNKYRQIMCGKMTEDAKFCPQDYSHTEATVDKDVNLNVVPNEKFKYMLKNKYLEDNYSKIEGEVNIRHSLVKDPDFPLKKKINPQNPLLLTLQKDDNVCLSGPWMADILEFEFGKYDATPYENNEIHPINQVWFKKRDELNLVAIADGTPYFHKRDQRQFEASGLNQQSKFYVAFEIPPDVLNGTANPLEYQINGTGYSFSFNPGGEISSNILTYKYKGKVCMKITDNGLLKRHKTHDLVSLKHVRMRPDGSIQGYILIETVKITAPGGSINIFVRKIE